MERNALGDSEYGYNTTGFFAAISLRHDNGTYVKYPEQFYTFSYELLHFDDVTGEDLGGRTFSMRFCNEKDIKYFYREENSTAENDLVNNYQNYLCLQDPE